MSGFRAVDVGLLMPDRGDSAPARPRALSYDFSRWNGQSASELHETGPVGGGRDDALAADGASSFKVYTPAEIKRRPMPVRRTPLPPQLQSGINGIQEALELARSLGPKRLLARVGVGVGAGAIMLVAVIGFARLADDPPETRGALTARTDAPLAAPAIAEQQAADTVLGDVADDVAAPTYFEVPDTTPAKGAKTARGGAAMASAKRVIVRVSPF